MDLGILATHDLDAIPLVGAAAIALGFLVQLAANY